MLICSYVCTKTSVRFVKVQSQARCVAGIQSHPSTCIQAAQRSRKAPYERAAALGQDAPCRALQASGANAFMVLVWTCVSRLASLPWQVPAAHALWRTPGGVAASLTSVHGDDEVKRGRIRQPLSCLQRVVQCDVGLLCLLVNPAVKPVLFGPSLCLHLRLTTRSSSSSR
jgi:hypothetical protein